MIPNKPNFFELLKDKNKILKRKKNKNQSKILSIKMVGGYTNNDTLEWIKYFLLKENINSDITESQWGPAYQNLNLINHKEKFDYFIIINSSKDLLSDLNWSELRLKEKHIKKIFFDFFSNIDNKKNFIVLAYDKPKLDINTSEGNLNKIIDDLNLYLKETINDEFPNGIFLDDINRNEDEFNNNDYRDWYSFGKVLGQQQSVNLSKIIAYKILKKIRGLKKIVILDLDNTLWGGVVGDSNIKDLQVGDETAEGRIFRDIQAYMKMLKNNGLMLAIVSKNEEKIALNFLKNKRNILKINDFVSHRINWEKKYKNILSIQEELNIGLESFIFIDDNSSERFEVQKFLPDVSVPDLNCPPEDFLSVINSYDYFNLEKTKVTEEDKQRTKLYFIEKKRTEHRESFDNYETFLKSLKIKLSISSLNSNNIDRVHQLTNKTNQFNFTTKRMELKEIRNFEKKGRKIFVVNAEDDFGNHGIISVVYVDYIKEDYEIVNWLMSCRVFNKSIENSIMHELINHANQNNKKKIKIKYIKSKKNLILKTILLNLGFSKGKKNGVFDLNLKEKINLKKGYCKITYEKNKLFK